MSEVEKGLVLYTDGSARPNPGFAGYGIHGYVYEKTIPKKGAGLPSHIPTDNGYRMKIDAGAKEDAVTVLNYLDIHQPLPGPTTNNAAEVEAATAGYLLAANTEGIKKVAIFTDSEYTQNGINKKWVKAWQKNGWVNRDGRPVQNKERWIALMAAEEAAKKKGIETSISWVKGHGTNPGNNTADSLSVIGTMKSTAGILTGGEVITPADGYWKEESDRHPFLALPILFFNTYRGSNKPGVYYTGTSVKDGKEHGSPISDASFAVSIMKEPVAIVEWVRDYQSELAMNGMIDSLVLLKLDKLFVPKVRNYLTTYDRYATVKKHNKEGSLLFLDGEALTEEKTPVKLVMNAISELSELHNLLEQHLNGTLANNYSVTDVTDIFYQRETVKDKKGNEKTTVELKKEFGVGHAKTDVEVSYKTSEDKELRAMVTLSHGVDAPVRNALKKLEDVNTKLQVVTWTESDSMFRYATIVEHLDGHYIQSGTYSNLRFVKAK